MAPGFWLDYPAQGDSHPCRIPWLPFPDSVSTASFPMWRSSPSATDLQTLPIVAFECPGLPRASIPLRPLSPTMTTSPIFVRRNIRPVLVMDTPNVNGNLDFTVNLQVSVLGQTAEAGILWCIRNNVSNGPEFERAKSCHTPMGSAHPRHEGSPASLELHHRDMSSSKSADSREVTPLSSNTYFLVVSSKVASSKLGFAARRCPRIPFINR